MSTHDSEFWGQPDAGFEDETVKASEPVASSVKPAPTTTPPPAESHTVPPPQQQAPIQQSSTAAHLVVRPTNRLTSTTDTGAQQPPPPQSGSAFVPRVTLPGSSLTSSSDTLLPGTSSSENLAEITVPVVANNLPQSGGITSIPKEQVIESGGTNSLQAGIGASAGIILVAVVAAFIVKRKKTSATAVSKNPFKSSSSTTSSGSSDIASFTSSCNSFASSPTASSSIAQNYANKLIPSLPPLDYYDDNDGVAPPKASKQFLDIPERPVVNETERTCSIASSIPASIGSNNFFAKTMRYYSGASSVEDTETDPGHKSTYKKFDSMYSV